MFPAGGYDHRTLVPCSSPKSTLGLKPLLYSMGCFPLCNISPWFDNHAPLSRSIRVHRPTRCISLCYCVCQRGHVTHLISFMPHLARSDATLTGKVLRDKVVIAIVDRDLFTKLDVTNCFHNYFCTHANILALELGVGITAMVDIACPVATPRRIYRVICVFAGT